MLETMPENHQENSTSPEGLGSGAVLEQARREKLRRISEMGIDPWGSRFDDHLPIQEIRAREGEIIIGETPPIVEGERPKDAPQTGPRVRAAGRIILQRKKGKLLFLDLWDWSGRIQVLIGASQVGERAWELAQCFDLGDIIGIDGELRKTKTGELSIFADGLHFLSKSLETPPAKFHGLTDPDLRSRMRYMDMVHTSGVLDRFLQRSQIIQSIRQTLTAEKFVEVEGPTLHTLAGGAAARPFRTHHNTLDMPLVMRIALELHLKRLLVGGMERVYEIGRVYRNEGISTRHNPEFTMLELYQAYGDYHSMMEITEKIIDGAIRAMGVAHQISWGEKIIDFTPPFTRKTYFELFAEQTNIDPLDERAVLDFATAKKIETRGRDIDLVRSDIFEACVEDSLIGPIFVTDYPARICPLTKRKASAPHLAERFELFVHGMELANAYTELNDPDLQEKLFSAQLAGQKEDDSMARVDNDFVKALRHGMPPAGGLGIGIDRLVMLLTGATSIREVILFPLQRPE